MTTRVAPQSNVFVEAFLRFAIKFHHRVQWLGAMQHEYAIDRFLALYEEIATAYPQQLASVMRSLQQRDLEVGRTEAYSKYEDNQCYGELIATLNNFIAQYPVNVWHSQIQQYDAIVTLIADINTWSKFRDEMCALFLCDCLPNDQNIEQNRSLPGMIAFSVAWDMAMENEHHILSLIEEQSVSLTYLHGEDDDNPAAPVRDFEFGRYTQFRCAFSILLKRWQERRLPDDVPGRALLFQLNTLLQTRQFTKLRYMDSLFVKIVNERTV